MKHTQEEIINALKVIKDECESHNCGNGCDDSCEECCFYFFHSGCMFIETFPFHWKINEKEDVWRAFK